MIVSLSTANFHSQSPDISSNHCDNFVRFSHGLRSAHVVVNPHAKT
jgi:hypothetical protein